MTVDTSSALGAAATNGATGTGTASGPTAAQLAAGLRGAELALAASVVVTQIRSTFPNFANDGFAGAALTVAPVLLLNPASQGSGLGAFLTNPKVLAVAAVTGLVLANDMISVSERGVCAIRFVLDKRMDQKLAKGSRCKFIVDVFDDRGNSKPGENITFASSAPQILEVDADGVVKALEPGIATITASIGDKSDLVTVQVTPFAAEDRPEEGQPEEGRSGARHPSRSA